MFQSITEYFRRRRELREKAALEEVKARYHAFRIFLENNGRALELIIELDSLLEHGEEREIHASVAALLSVCGELVDGLHLLSGGGHGNLFSLYAQLSSAVNEGLEMLRSEPGETPFCLALDDLGPDAQRYSGTKAATLAQLRRMGLPAMDGFAVTTSACNRFLDDASLSGPIRSLLRERRRGSKTADVADVAGEIRKLILNASLPDDLARELDEAHQALCQRCGKEPALSVRSSAVAEDRPEHSFAGQFSTVLNVIGRQALHQAYKEVVASAFSPRAITYRRTIGLSPTDFDMAVLCQVMVDVRCAGVLLSRDPAAPDSGTMLVSAAPGLGTTAVDGSAPVDIYRPARSDSPGKNGPSEIARKTEREVASPGGGLHREILTGAEATLPLLDEETLRALVRHAQRIESLDGLPLDMEWAVDRDGHIRILQARPLHLPTRRPAGQGADTHQQAPILTTGISASMGKAVGRVRLVHSPAELAAVENPDKEPAILVMPQSLVDAARHLDLFEGIIVDVGNPTDHLSCVARESGVPMLTATRTASTTLVEGAWIVLDADNGHVLEADESLWGGARQRTRKEPLMDCSAARSLSPERTRLRELVVPLNLTDAYGPTFSLLECKSLHDLVRFSHEKAVLAMFDAGDSVMEEAGRLLRPLHIGVPFHFLVIDLGGGVHRNSSRRGLTREDVLSAPLAALCDGLTTPGLNWHSRPGDGALAQVLSRNMLDAASARPAGSFNYALAARDYLNLNARVEYHFAMLDAVCGSDERANYIRFRFKGGGAGMKRSHRRALFLKEVLEANGFVTVVTADLVTASLVGAAASLIRDKLVMLGRLFGYSRFLDGVMNDDETPGLLAKSFLAGRYDTREVGWEDDQA